MRLLAVLGAAAWTGCGPHDSVEVWRFAIEEPLGSVQHRYATGFEEAVERRTGGAIDVKVYPYGTLGTSDHITELLHNGSIELAMASPGHLGKLIPEVQVWLLHFVLSDDEAVNRRVLLDRRLHEVFDPLYAAKGFELLSFYSEGWMVWTADRPLRRPDDFAGLKMRVMTSPLLLAAYEAYGASPTPLPYGEVYSALQLSMIDAQVNPVFAIEEMSFHEVTDVLVFPGHAPFVTSAVANRAFLDRLPPARRTLVDEVITDLQETIDEVQQRYNTERLDIIRAERPDVRILTLDEAERQRFREASQPVRDTFLELAPDRGEVVLETLDRVVAEAGG